MSKLLEKLDRLHLPENVLKTALEINASLPDDLAVMKDSSRAYLIASEAYRTLGLLYEPDRMKDQLKISSKCAKEIIKDAARKGYRPVIVRYDPSVFINEQLYIAGISDSHHNAVAHLLDKVLTAYPALRDENPKQVCAGSILYYAPSVGFQLNMKEFCNHCGTAISSTQRVSSLVERSHNAA